jgi:hypothetical protein
MYNTELLSISKHGPKIDILVLIETRFPRKINLSQLKRKKENQSYFILMQKILYDRRSNPLMYHVSIVKEGCCLIIMTVIPKLIILFTLISSLSLLLTIYCFNYFYLNVIMMIMIVGIIA